MWLSPAPPSLSQHDPHVENRPTLSHKWNLKDLFLPTLLPFERKALLISETTSHLMTNTKVNGIFSLDPEGPFLLVSH